MVKHVELPAGPLLDGSLVDDPLAPEPAPLEGGILIGYARVSTGGQPLDRQTTALKAAGCARGYADKKSGKDIEREELWKVLEYARPGDTLVVPSLDRLSRSLLDLITIVAGLRECGVGFRSMHEAIDTTTPGGRLVFHVFAAWPNSSANSSCRARARVWTRPAPCSLARTNPSLRSPGCWTSAAPLRVRPRS